MALDWLGHLALGERLSILPCLEPNCWPTDRRRLPEQRCHMGANYIIIDSVGHGRTRLSLRQRTDLGPPFHLVAWREQRPGGSNRRFYFEKGVVWHLDAGVALSLMVQAAAQDLLSARYDDPFLLWGGGKPDFLVSQELSPSRRAQAWDEITLSLPGRLTGAPIRSLSLGPSLLESGAK